jgi:hypothetical protein
LILVHGYLIRRFNNSGTVTAPVSAARARMDNFVALLELLAELKLNEAKNHLTLAINIFGAGNYSTYCKTLIAILNRMAPTDICEMINPYVRFCLQMKPKTAVDNRMAPNIPVGQLSPIEKEFILRVLAACSNKPNNMAQQVADVNYRLSNSASLGRYNSIGNAPRTPSLGTPVNSLGRVSSVGMPINSLGRTPSLGTPDTPMGNVSLLPAGTPMNSVGSRNSSLGSQPGSTGYQPSSLTTAYQIVQKNAPPLVEIAQRPQPREFPQVTQPTIVDFTDSLDDFSDNDNTKLNPLFNYSDDDSDDDSDFDKYFNTPGSTITSGATSVAESQYSTPSSSPPKLGR